MQKHFLLIALLLICNTAFSQNAPKYSNEFLSIGIGARSLAMSNATVASVSDISATFWNPAALTKINHDLQVGYMHAEYFAGIAKYDYGAISRKLSDNKVIGISIIRFGVDDIPNTLELIDNNGNIRYDRIKSFSAADYAFVFSYAALSPIENLTYGGNVKVIRRKTGEFADSWGFGIDLSAQYDYKEWLFGVVIRDVTTTFNAWSFHNDLLEETYLLTGNELPTNSLELTLPKMILAAARNFTINEKFGVLAECDLNISTDGKRNVLIKGDPFSIDPHIGIEGNFKKMVFVRMGVGDFQKIPGFDGTDDLDFQPNVGLGIKIDRLTIDYALTDIGNQSQSLYTNVISLNYSIDKK